MAPPGMLVHKITVVFIVVIIIYESGTDNFCQRAGPCCSRCLIKGQGIELRV